MVDAAFRCAAAVVLSAADVLIGLAENGGVGPERPDPWARLLPSAVAVVVFAILTGAFALRANWARPVTVATCCVFSLATAIGLTTEAVFVAAGTSTVPVGPGYFPFRCVIAVLSIVLYLTTVIVFIRPSRRVHIRM